MVEVSSWEYASLTPILAESIVNPGDLPAETQLSIMIVPKSHIDVRTSESNIVYVVEMI